MRIIDADEFIKIIREHDYPLATRNGSIDNGMFTNGILQAVDETPTINPESLRPKGEWEDISKVVHDLDGDWVATQFRCPLCGRKEYKREPFCNCGADMRGDNNER